MAAKRDMGAGSDGIFDAARDLGVVRRGGGQTHLETLIIYKLGSTKFTTQNDFYW